MLLRLFWLGCAWLVVMLFCLTAVGATEEIRLPMVNDTYTEELFPITLPSDNRNVYVGYDTLYNKGKTRVWWQINWSDWADWQLPANQIIQAKANWYLYQSEARNSFSVEVGTLPQWRPTALYWSSQPANNQLMIVAQPRWKQTAGWQQADITDALRAEYQMKQANQLSSLWQLRLSDESGAASIFWSSQCAVAPNEPRCSAQEPFVAVVIDRTPPPTPVIDLEPPYTNGDRNTVEWAKVKDDSGGTVEYQLQRAGDADFAQDVIESPWVTATYYEFIRLAEQEYWYRLRAHDALGNISDWSVSTHSAQDQHPPVITQFTTSPQVISPDGTTSRGLYDYTVVSLRVIDPTFHRGHLTVYDQDQQLVYERAITQVHEEVHWPTASQQKLPEGEYFLYYEADDNFGQTRHQGPVTVVIDNTPPPEPRITSPDHDLLTNAPTINLRYQASSTELVTAQVDARPLKVTGHVVTVPLGKEGKHTVILTAIDIAGNRGQATRVITVDHTAPALDQVKLQVTSKALSLSIKGESNSTVIITQNGRLLPTTLLLRGSSTYPLPVNLDHEQAYRWEVRLRDAAGNLSRMLAQEYVQQFGVGSAEDLVNVKKYPPEPESIVCQVGWQLDTFRVVHEACQGLQLSLGTAEVHAASHNWKLTVFGAGHRQATIVLAYYRCQTKHWYNPLTWWCRDQVVKEATTAGVTGSPVVQIQAADKVLPEQPVLHWGDHGQVLVAVNSSDNLSSQPVQLVGTARWFWFDQFSQEFMVISQIYAPSNVAALPIFPVLTEASGYFSWIFKDFPGVTQWHGHTAYQNPHAGIDFGVSHEPILAPADGTIVSAGYDRYGGQCNQGGNYLGILHPNGLYTYYFHLEHYRQSNGVKWKVGNVIKRGEQVGLSGNSGRYNCQPLQYHLHFEVRTCRSASCHVNPVPYFAIDWARITTLSVGRFPLRLRGDNPHPSW